MSTRRKLVCLKRRQSAAVCFQQQCNQDTQKKSVHVVVGLYETAGTFPCQKCFIRQAVYAFLEVILASVESEMVVLHGLVQQDLHLGVVTVHQAFDLFQPLGEHV